MSLTSGAVPDTKISQWKTAVKSAQTDILRLASSAPSQASTNVPNAFGNVKIDVPKPDLSARKYGKSMLDLD